MLYPRLESQGCQVRTPRLAKRATHAPRQCLKGFHCRRSIRYMKADLNAELPKGTEPAQALGKVLLQSERAKALVEEFAKELSLVNRALKQEIASRDPLPGVQGALEKNEAVAKTMQETTQDLTDVIQALKSEVRDREMLNHQFAAITEQEEAARHAAIHDFLTGLPNRVLVNDRLEQGLAQARRQAWTVAVMFIDLEKFKDMNYSHGHGV